MANLTSFLILVLFFWGRSLRFKNLSLHIRVMWTALACDFLLVFALVFFRDALNKVNMDMPWTLKVHVPIAISTLGLYVITAWQGVRLYRGDESARIWLRRFDRLLVTSRVLTFVTSMMVTVLRD
jgi:hypothetical protein